MSSTRQRTLCLFGLVGLLGAAGCVDSDPPAFTVGWDLAYIVDAERLGAQVNCQDAGTPVVELTMTNRSSRRTTINTFNCAQFGAESESLPAGHYDVKIALKNQDGEEVSNDAGDWTLVRDGLTDLGLVTFPIQSFHLSWSLARGPARITCQQAGASTVNIITRRNSEPKEVVHSLPCEAGSGSTRAILLGSYSVQLQLIGTSGAVLWQADMPMTIPVNDSARAVLLPVVFNL
jgi:hypothetical protein